MSTIKGNHHQATSLKSWSDSKSNGAVVIGLYGVPGSGKTFLLNQLKKELGEEDFVFVEGSKMIASLVPGGLDAFVELEEAQKSYWRQLAIDTIGLSSAQSGKVAIFAGHFMFWSEEDEAGQVRRRDDMERNRPSPSASHITRWQQAEKKELRHLCRNHGILFTLVIQTPTTLNDVSMLVRDFCRHTEAYNLSQAENRLDGIVAADEGRLKTMLVMDADRTLSPQDTGELFWQKVTTKDDADPLKTLFCSPLHYSYTAFRQAVLLYKETRTTRSLTTSAKMWLLPCALVVTCELRRVWEKVLERKGLSKKVKILGGGRITDGFVVTAAVKSALVSRLQHTHQMYVWGFENSPLDLEMLCVADQAIVVTSEEQTRRKTMDLDLFNLIYNGSLRARQVVLQSHATPRLNFDKLPPIQLASPEFVNSLFHHHRREAELQVLHATGSNAAKLLMTPMRDARNTGPILREAPGRVGRYLATELLAKVVGVEEYPISHVQGHQTSGFRLSAEQETTIRRGWGLWGLSWFLGKSLGCWIYLVCER